MPGPRSIRAAKPLLARLLHRQSVGALTGRAAFLSHGVRSRNRLGATLPLLPQGGSGGLHGQPLGTYSAMGLRHELLDTHPRAMRRLRELRGQPIGEAGDGLVELLEHPARDLRVDAAMALGKARWRPAVPPLIERLRDPHPWVVAWAADALGKIGDKRAVPALSAVLERADATARVYAAQALGRIDHRTAVPSLIAALEDPKRGVFTESKDALERLVQPEDRQSLEQVANRLGRYRRRKLKRVFAVLEERQKSSL